MQQGWFCFSLVASPTIGVPQPPPPHLSDIEQLVLGDLSFSSPAYARGDSDDQIRFLGSRHLSPIRNVGQVVHTKQMNIMKMESKEDRLRKIVIEASAAWNAAYNAHDAEACGAFYEEDAVMIARPFGTFTGGAAITAFWQKLMNHGFHTMEFMDMKIEVLDECRAILTAGWVMKGAKGWIHKELWVARDDGQVRLREKDFGMSVIIPPQVQNFVPAKEAYVA